MHLEIHITWLRAGAIAGFLAGLILKTGNSGLRTDLLLGLAEASSGSRSPKGSRTIPRRRC
jgi:uncharacterized membrane protein YeaQ/YmgE (transglycosylase-associated protein family)